MMKEYVRRFDEVVLEMNRWLLAIAIGLALLDLTMFCTRHATALARVFLEGDATATAERSRRASSGWEVLPRSFRGNVLRV
jgi:hypothetical protein